MSDEQTDWRETRKWTRAQGVPAAVCPCCGALVDTRLLDMHADVCPAIADAMGAAGGDDG